MLSIARKKLSRTALKWIEKKNYSFHALLFTVNRPRVLFNIGFVKIKGRQFSLDSRMDLVFHGIETNARKPAVNVGLDDKSDAITEDSEESWEGMKGRYCSGHNKI